MFDGTRTRRRRPGHSDTRQRDTWDEAVFPRFRTGKFSLLGLCFLSPFTVSWHSEALTLSREWVFSYFSPSAWHIQSRSQVGESFAASLLHFIDPSTATVRVPLSLNTEYQAQIKNLVVCRICFGDPLRSNLDAARCSFLCLMLLDVSSDDKGQRALRAPSEGPAWHAPRRPGELKSSCCVLGTELRIAWPVISSCSDTVISCAPGASCLSSYSSWLCTAPIPTDEAPIDRIASRAMLASVCREIRADLRAHSPALSMSTQIWKSRTHGPVICLRLT